MENLLTSAAPPGFESFAVLLRMAERILLTLFFVVTASIIMIVYRRKIQYIDLSLANEAGSLKTTTSLIMPVLILLTIILFTYIVLLNPVELETSQVAEHPAADSPHILEKKANSFVGYGSGSDAQQRLARDLLAVITASFNLRLATNAMTDGQREEIAPYIDGLGKGANGLRMMFFAIMNKRFPSQEDCYPNVLNNFQPSSETDCRDVNKFLFGQ